MNRYRYEPTPVSVSKHRRNTGTCLPRRCFCCPCGAMDTRLRGNDEERGRGPMLGNDDERGRGGDVRE